MNFKKFGYKLFSYWWVVFLAIIIYLSYGQTLNMYFWVDDWGMAYKMQHLDANIPNFGQGIFGDGAYRYNVTPFIALYPVLGLNAFPYFLIGIILYFLACLAVYLLVWELSKSKVVGIVSATVFASGYIGSDAMNHLNNSYQLVLTATLSMISSLLLIKYFQTNLKRYYIFSIIVYVAILEFLFLRSHGVFLLIFFTSVLAIIINNKQLKALVAVVPFFIIWIYMFFLDPRTSKEYDGVGRGDFLPNAINLLIKERHFELFNNLLISLSSVVFPDEVVFSFYRFISTKIHSQQLILSLFPILACFFVGYLYIRLNLSFKLVIISSNLLVAFIGYLIWSSAQVSAVWSADIAQLFISSLFGSFLIILGVIYFLPNIRSKLYLLYFGLAWIASNVLTYFIYSPHTNLASNTRYLIPAFVGTCILFGSIFNILSKKYRFVVVIFLVIYCSFLISLTNERASYIVKNISIPSREDLRIIKNTVLSMNKDTVFYIEAANESKYRISELGGIPHLAIPVILNYEGIAKVAISYAEIFYLLKNNKVELDNVHTFFGKNEQIINTSKEFRDLLSRPGEKQSISKWLINTANIGTICCNTKTIIVRTEDGSVGVNPIFETNIDYPSLVPIELTLNMKITPLDNFNLPFGDRTKFYTQPADQQSLILYKEALTKEKLTPIDLITQEELERYLKSEYERMMFYKDVKISANSSEKTREVEFIKDNKSFTSWEASTIDWRSGKRPVELVFNFNERTFSEFIWINYTPKDTPTDYVLSVSDDGISWKIIKHVQMGVRESGEIVTDSFSPTKAKYLKFSINSTYGGNTSVPAITEAWIGNTLPVTAIDKLELLSNCMICNVKNEVDLTNIRSLYRNIAKAKVSWVTDKNTSYNTEDYKDFYINMDGLNHTYKIYIPAQGRKIKRIKLEGFNYPVEILIDSASVKSMNLEEMIAKDLIHDFAGN